MKVPLADQITEAELHRNDLAGHSTDQSRLHRAEAIVLSLRFLQTYEQGFRETFAQHQSTNHQAEA